MAETQKKVTYIKGKAAKKAYAKKVKLAEKKRKQNEKKEKKLLKEWRDRTKKQQDSGNRLTRWFRKKTTGSDKSDRGGPHYDYVYDSKSSVQKKITDTGRTPAGKERYKKYMKGKKWDERKKKREAKAEYYHKTGKAPLFMDLPGVPSKLHKLFNPEFKDRKKAAEYGQPIVKYKKGGTVKKTYAYGGRIRKAKYTKE